MAPDALPDPLLSLRWLSQARRGFLAAQLGLLLITRLGTEVRPPLVAVLGVLGLLGAFDLVERARWSRGAPGPGRVGAHAAVDLAVLTATLLLTGGSQSPLVAFYLVEVALLAIVLPRGPAWAATLAAMALQAGVTVFARDVPGMDDEPHHHLAHLLGHVLAFDVAAVAITAFVGRVTAQLRAREAALRAAEADRAQAERLAALGSLAAGTAHALGTPLGAIELLAEEMALDLPETAEGRAAHGELVGQVRRCRAILDRMLAGDQGAEGRTPKVARGLARWAESWREAQGEDPALRVEIAPLDRVARGAEEGWRDALWTLLDNARAAGGPIEVSATPAETSLIVVVRDHGPPVPAERLARAGQPFFSAWLDRKGAGLGLYVARSFARAAGGDLILAPRASGGAQATLTIPLEAP